MAFLNAAANPDQRGGTWPTFQIIGGSQVVGGSDQPPRLVAENYWRGRHLHQRKVITVGQNWLMGQLAAEIQQFVDGS